MAMQKPIKPQDQMTLEQRLRASTEAWFKRYERLQWAFPEEEAHEYAEEMTQVAEGKKRETQRSPYEIKREMKLLIHMEGLVQGVRVLVVAAICVFPFLWQPAFLPDSGILVLGWMLACWISAGVVGCRRFWKDYLDVLRRRRLQCFWEWRSADSRFPVQSISPSGLSERSELPPEAGESQNKPPYLLD